jgi:hypothetical protein
LYFIILHCMGGGALIMPLFALFGIGEGFRSLTGALLDMICGLETCSRLVSRNKWLAKFGAVSRLQSYLPEWHGHSNLLVRPHFFDVRSIHAGMLGHAQPPSST